MRNLGRLLVVALFPAAAIAGGIAACGSTTPAVDPVDSGADGSPEAEAAPADTGADAGSCNLPGSYGSKECTACVGASCCGQVTACEADPRCKILQKCNLDCLSTLDAGGCRTNCEAIHSDGKPLWELVDRCWFNNPDAGGCLIECTCTDCT